VVAFHRDHVRGRSLFSESRHSMSLQIRSVIKKNKDRASLDHRGRLPSSENWRSRSASCALLGVLARAARSRSLFLVDHPRRCIRTRKEDQDRHLRFNRPTRRTPDSLCAPASWIARPALIALLVFLLHQKAIPYCG
jgi:hypothetical protein